jgi:hypothetical protein
LQGAFVEAGDEFGEGAGWVVADGVAEDGAGDAFLVRLGEGLRGKEPVDEPAFPGPTAAPRRGGREAPTFTIADSLPAEL